MVKLYEKFVEYDKLNSIIKQIETRVKFWFTEKGTLSKDTNLTDITSTQTNMYSSRTVKLDFSDMSFMYQVLFTVYAEFSDKCKITFKRYNLTEQKLIDTFNDEIDVNDVKEDYIISLISDINDKDENPDNSKIFDKDFKSQVQGDTITDDNEIQPQSQPQSQGDDFNLGGFDDGEIQEDESDF